MTRWLLTALVLLASSAAAQTVQADGSEIGFVSRQMGVPVEGRFASWKAELAFDPQAPQSGRVGFSIDTGSARLGGEDIEAELRKPEWFDVVKFPQARFRSSAIKAAGPGRYEVTGDLTIKGRSQQLVVPVALDGRTASGRFTIRRLGFGIGGGDWSDTSLVADEVEVHFKLVLVGLKP
jgi:polyisoprenoid-binding protein YceI